MNTNEKFLLNNSKHIVIYGAGTNGVVVCNNLLRMSYKIDAFIDQRYKEIQEINGIPVVGLDYDFPCDIVFVISVKNVFEHENIVELLVNKGYKNIIYKPYACLIKNVEGKEKILSDLYDNTVKPIKNTINGEYPKTLRLSRQSVEDSALIYNIDDKEVLVNIPIEFVFTDIKKGEESAWANIGVMCMFPHIKLFQFFDNDNQKNADNYLKFCRESALKNGNNVITESWEKNVIKNRYDVYKHMDLFYNIDYQFFYRSAPSGSWNNKGYFNLVGGKHRITYLIAKGIKYVPLRITNSDYQKFVNNSSFEEIKKILCTNNSLCIEHPYLYNRINYKIDFYQRFLQKLISSLSEKIYNEKRKFDFSTINILVDLDDDGYCSRLLSRYGFCVYRTKSTPLVEILDKISYQTHNILQFNEFIKLDYIISNNEDIIKTISVNKEKYFISSNPAMISSDYIAFPYFNGYLNKSMAYVLNLRKV